MPGQSTWSHGCGFAGARQWHDGQIAHHSHALVARRANPSQSASLLSPPNHWHLSAHPVPIRGAYASSRTLVRDAVDALATLDERRVRRTAKSCGPDAPTLASSSREASFLGATVARKPGHRGEREISRKTIAQGMPDCLR
jgi:hypothetical protein